MLVVIGVFLVIGVFAPMLSKQLVDPVLLVALLVVAVVWAAWYVVKAWRFLTQLSWRRAAVSEEERPESAEEQEEEGPEEIVAAEQLESHQAAGESPFESPPTPEDTPQPGESNASSSDQEEGGRHDA
jgi:4-amino-4-deoxy-L-arabinose transferase-like glycosyltransferase